MIRGTSGPDGMYIKFPQVERPRFKLFYFPFSGGGATTGNRFASHLPAGTEVVCFNAPSKTPLGAKRFPDWKTFVSAVYELLVEVRNPFHDDGST